MTTGQRMKHLRNRKNLDQQGLAAELGHQTLTLITKWESDQSLPNGRELKNLAQFFGVSVDYLLGLDHLIKSKSPLQKLKP